MTRLLRHPRRTLFIILLLALVLRLISLADHSLWYDEAFSVLFAQADIDTMLNGTVNAVEHPLLYYLTLKGWMQAFGTTALSARLWSVITGVLSIGLIYLITEKLFQPRTALLAALMVSLSPFHLQYSQEARMYSLLLLLLLLTTYTYLRGRESHQWGWWIAFGISAGLAMHTQQLAAFYLVVLGLLPVVAREWRVFARLTLGAIIALVIFSSWLVNLPQQLTTLNQNYWIESPTLAKAIVTPGLFMGGYHEFSGMALPLVFGGTLFIVLFALIQITLDTRRPRRESDNTNHHLGILLWLTLTPIILMWIVSQWLPIYIERALITNSVLLIMILAWLFSESHMPRIVKSLLFSITILIFGVGIIQQYALNSFPYVPLDEAMQIVNENAQIGDRVVHLDKLTMLPAVIYAPDTPQTFLADTEGAADDTLDPSTQAVLKVQEQNCIMLATADANRIWFVTLDRAERELQAANDRQYVEMRGWLSEVFETDEIYKLTDMTLTLYHNGRENRQTDCEAS